MLKIKDNILKRSNRKLSIAIDCIQCEQLAEKKCFKWSIFPFSSKIYMIKYRMKRQPIDNQILQNNVWEAGFPEDMRLSYFSLGIFAWGKNVCASTAEGLFRKKQSKMASTLTCNFDISYLIFSVAEMSKYTSRRPCLKPYLHYQIEPGR